MARFSDVIRGWMTLLVAMSTVALIQACGAAETAPASEVPDPQARFNEADPSDVSVEADITGSDGKEEGPLEDVAEEDEPPREADSAQGPCATLAEGAPCDDGNACTSDDQCSAGVCVGGVNTVCDDLSACQEASCDPALGCVYNEREDGAACEAPCFESASCQAGSCVADESSAILCPEPEAPCIDALGCDPATGACTLSDYAPAATPCNLDENLCTLEACDGAGTCIDLETNADCSDENLDNPCWTWTCTPKTGCVQTSFLEGNSCDDNNPCSSNDTCTLNEFNQETCIGTPIPIDDGNPCTDDACVDGVISHAPIDGAVCESECGPGLCEASECVSSEPCGCVSDAECSELDNACKGYAYCDIESGKCLIDPSTAIVCPEVDFPCAVAYCDSVLETCAMGPVAEGTPCDDATACIEEGGCVGQLCQGGVTPNCDDEDPCTTDACIPGQGCVYTEVETPQCGFGDLPVAWYRFEEQVGPLIDSTGNGHDGSENPGGITRGVEGAIGLAAQFNGSSGSFQVPAHPDLDFSEAATIEVWVWLSTTSGTGSVVSRGTGNNDNNVLMNSSSGNMQTIFSQTGVGTTNVTSASGLIPTQTWTHIAVVNEPEGLRCYFNGELVKTAPGGLMGFIANDLFIGRREQGIFSFNGKIDELKWWTEARTQEQICADAEGVWNGASCAL